MLRVSNEITLNKAAHIAHCVGWTHFVRLWRRRYVYLMLKPALILISVLSLSACASNRIIDVRVLNESYQPITVINDPSKIEEINQIWSTRVEIDRIKEFNFPYKIDMNAVRRMPRWVYHPSGFLRAIAIKSNVPDYKIPNPERFNELLGIHNQALKAQPSAAGTPQSGAP